MAQSARFAWWLLIMLFGGFILYNNLTFLTLFTRQRDTSLNEEDIRYELDFQLRYALFFAGSPMLHQGWKPAAEGVIQSIQRELYGTEAEWEARLYVALLEQLTETGDPRQTLKSLPDAPALQLDPHERRWYTALWQTALLDPLSIEQVERLHTALAPSVSPLAMRLAESLMWQRAGDTRRAQQRLQTLGRESRLRLSVLGLAVCCGLLWALTGVGLLIWYRVQSFPLAERPLPDHSPFALDPMLWAPVLFLLVLLGGAAFVASIPSSREMSTLEPAFLVVYLTAALVPLFFLLEWSRESNHPSGVLRFRGRFGQQLGAALMGFGIYLPLMLLSLLLTLWLMPALPREQTNPIAERLLSEMNAWELFWTIALSVLFAPVVEEILFRGVLFQVLWQRTGRVWLSAFVSGFLFGVIHPQFLGGILSVTLLGVILAMVYAHTRSLLPCMLIHALNNGMAMLFFWVFAG